MNTIFIDIKEEKNNNKESKNSIIGKIQNMFTKFVFREDFISSNYSSNYYLEINPSIADNPKYIKRIYSDEKKIERKIIRHFKPHEEIYVLFSKPVIDNLAIGSYIIEIFSSERFKNNKIIFADNKNELLENDIKYIDKYILDNKLSDKKIKLLVGMEYFEEYNEEKFRQYISRFKYVDVLRFSDMTKSDYKKLNGKLEELNNEYGTSITCIQRRNIQDYNVYISYTNYPKKEFRKKYITSKNSLYINMCDPSEDIFSEAYKTFKNNEVDVNILFKRLNMNIENFNKVELGNWLLYK